MSASCCIRTIYISLPHNLALFLVLSCTRKRYHRCSCRLEFTLKKFHSHSNYQIQRLVTWFNANCKKKLRFMLKFRCLWSKRISTDQIPVLRYDHGSHGMNVTKTYVTFKNGKKFQVIGIGGNNGAKMSNLSEPTLLE